MPFNDTAGNAMLDALDESASQITFVGIHTLAGGDPGQATNATGTEASGGSPAYARQAATWGAASGRQKSNTNAFTFDVPAGTYAYFTFWNVGTTANTGNYRGYAPFMGATPLKGFFSVDTTLTNDQLLSVGHGMANDDRVILYNVFAESLPTGLTEGTVYWVVSVATNTFKVSLTQGGAAVDITAVGGGEGHWARVVPEVFGSQGQITVAAGQLVLDNTGI